MSKAKTLKERTIALLDKNPRKKFTFKEVASRLNRGSKKTVNTGAVGVVCQHLPGKYKKRIVSEAA